MQVQKVAINVLKTLIETCQIIYYDNLSKLNKPPRQYSKRFNSETVTWRRRGVVHCWNSVYHQQRKWNHKYYCTIGFPLPKCNHVTQLLCNKRVIEKKITQHSSCICVYYLVNPYTQRDSCMLCVTTTTTVGFHFTVICVKKNTPNNTKSHDRVVSWWEMRGLGVTGLGRSAGSRRKGGFINGCYLNRVRLKLSKLRVSCLRPNNYERNSFAHWGYLFCYSI